MRDIEIGSSADSHPLQFAPYRLPPVGSRSHLQGDSMSALDTRLPQLLRGAEPLAGMFVGIPSPALMEMCGYAGFDFVIIDNEHGPASLETTEHLIRAARCAGTIPVARP